MSFRGLEVSPMWHRSIRVPESRRCERPRVRFRFFEHAVEIVPVPLSSLTPTLESRVLGKFNAEEVAKYPSFNTLSATRLARVRSSSLDCVRTQRACAQAHKARVAPI